MPKIPVFGKKKFKKGLRALGITINTRMGRGAHELGKAPAGGSAKNKYRNLTIPAGKEYHDPGFRRELLRQVVAVTGQPLEDVLRAITTGKKIK